MNKLETLRIYQAILMFFDTDTKSYVQKHTGLSDSEILMAERWFKELRFFPEREAQKNE